MRRLSLAAVALSLCVFALFAQKPETPGRVAPQAHPAPIPSGFDAASLDRTADPCVDFYQYACGTWMANNPIPPDQSRWGTFEVLAERNREVLRQILENASRPASPRGDVEQKIGDFYAACMDMPAINGKGIRPLQPALERVEKMQSKEDLASELARLHGDAVSALFQFGSSPDLKDSSHNIAQADQGGLGLPDRDYYLKTDAHSAELRGKYVAHVRRMFELLGHSPAKARTEAETVMRIETVLARNSLDRVTRRDPAAVYHKVSRKELQDMAPSFNWPKYLEGIAAPPFESLNVMAPDFFRGMEKLIAQTSLPDWKTYLTWRLVHDAAPLLPDPFVEENFAFFGRTLNGARELRPRWKRCVDFTDAALGEALGQKYVERTFGAEGKERTLRMVESLEKALGEDIRGLPWMTEATKKKALGKLAAITNKIGYPDQWRDYSSVKVTRDDALGNAGRASEFEFSRQIRKIGRPVDRTEWFMTPPTVNAYYSPDMNNINFPAGILQPPFYSNQADDALNFGGIGAVIGHELTHGFDDEGRHFDAKGNLDDWWTAQDAREFEKRAQCFVDEYAQFTVAGRVYLNGKLTLGENVADNGGLRIALMALLDRLARAGEQSKIDAFTPTQRLFLGWGQIWCQNVTEQNARLRAQVDPHSPGRYRVNGVLRNMPEFQKAFGCTAGQPMVSAQQCRAW